MQYTYLILIALALIAGNILIGVFFLWRQLPEMYRQRERERNWRTAELRAAWLENKAKEQARIADRELKVAKKQERASTLATKRAAREQYRQEHEGKKAERDAARDKKREELGARREERAQRLKQRDAARQARLARKSAAE